MAKLRFLFIILFFAISVHAQDTSYLFIQNDRRDKDIFAKNPDEENTFYSVAERDVYLQKILLHVYSSGYLGANYAITSERNDTAFVVFEKGNKIVLAQLNVSGIDKVFLSGADYRGKDFANTTFRYDEIVSLMESMLEFAEDHGYPFATVQLDSVRIADSILSAKLLFNRNRLIQFDTIAIEGNLELTENYLQQYTGIKPGEIYNESLIKDLDERLKELAFANVIRSSQVQFFGQKAKVIVYLDEKNASRFDFLIGILPNNEIVGRLIITGEGTLHLNNVFNAGELIDIHFSKLELTTKELESRLTYPYLPFISLGIDASFDLFLKDSTFLERKSSVGLLYQFMGNNYVKAFTSFYNSDVLNIDTASVLETLTLPANLDVENVGYGLAFNFEKLNYIYNPRKGVAFYISASAGTKTIKENTAITSLFDPENPEFDFAGLYDSVDTRSLNIMYQYSASFYQPVLKNTSIVFKINGASVINDQIFENELYRIGGINLLRGFDDKTILASQYHVLTAELRYLLSQNSYAGIFFDQAYTEDASKALIEKDFPFGFGAGITFETKAGIFAVNYALGSQQNNPVQLKNAKIHFGYLNYF